MKKVPLIIVGAILVTILFLLMMQLLGYKFNKKFINFDRKQCIEQEYPTYYHHSGIEGCIFWMRHNYLEKTQSWENLFKRDDAYCDQKYKNEDKLDIKNLFQGEYVDPKCTYSAFQKIKRDENWDYLVSKEKDIDRFSQCHSRKCLAYA